MTLPPWPPDAPGPLLAVDFGERRVGLALSDPGRRLAVPLVTLARRKDRQVVAAIRDIAQREGVAGIVVGEPLQPGGGRGPAADRARRFAAKLGKATGLPCRLLDESLTSHEAARRLREAGSARAGRDPRVDQVAAQILLEEALRELATAEPETDDATG